VEADAARAGSEQLALGIAGRLWAKKGSGRQTGRAYLLPLVEVLLLHRVHAERRLQLAHAGGLVLGHLDEGRLQSTTGRQRGGSGGVGQSERTMQRPVRPWARQVTDKAERDWLSQNTW
jgi:hypothetical protein